MKFVYVSDKNWEDKEDDEGNKIEANPPSRTKMYGVSFELNGPAMEVPKQYEEKFLNNQCFELVSEPEPEPEPEPAFPKTRGRPKKDS